jgi:hypothetical protein
MKLGAMDNDPDSPTLGEAIAHVLEQPSEEHYLFDIVTEDGLINHASIREIARSEDFALWQNQPH